MISWLRAKGLAEHGEDVALVAAKGSRAPEGVVLMETVPPGGDEKEAFTMYEDAVKAADIVIDDSWQKWSYTEKLKDESLKIMGVVHSPCPYRTAPGVKFPCFVGVSKVHARYLSERLQIPVRHVYNGIDPDMYPLQKEKGKRYLSLNRIMPEKSIHNFIDIIRRARSFGDIVGNDKLLVPDQHYVERIRTLSDGFYVRYWGEVSHERKLEFLKNAKATIVLNSPSWLEVFGLMVTESLACGTPVITLKGIGGPEEIVEHGKSGFICSTTDEIVETVKADKASEIEPDACRERAEQFTYKVMAEKYLKLYTEILADSSNEW